jgi:hypothetical protein
MRYQEMEVPRERRQHIPHFRNRACPTCYRPNRLTQDELRQGFQCSDCDLETSIRIVRKGRR